MGDIADMKKNPPTVPNPKKTNCPACGKRVKIIGLPYHMRDAHNYEGAE
jgi:hypothetical protein